MYKKDKNKQNKQISSIQTPKKVRCFTHTFDNLTISELLALLEYYPSSSSPCAQKQIKSVTIRYTQSDKSLPQMSPSSSPQRKLLRLKNSPNKRNGMERVHTKGKTRNSKNKQTVLRVKAPRARRIK